MDEITLPKAEYDRLVRERDEFKSKFETAESEKSDAVREAEKAESEKVAAEEKATALQAKVDGFEETARQADLATERFDALGKGFVGKIGEKTLTRLRTQAGSMTDEDWASRLDELEEMTGAKRDLAESDEDGGDGNGKSKETAGRKSGEFSEEEIARSAAGRQDDKGVEQSKAARRSVIGTLIS